MLVTVFLRTSAFRLLTDYNPEREVRNKHPHFFPSRNLHSSELKQRHGEKKKKSQHILSSSYTSQQLGFTFQPTPPLATQNAVSGYFKTIKSEFVILPSSVTPWHQRCHFRNCTVSHFRVLSCPKIRWFRAGQHARKAHLCELFSQENK